MQRYQVNCYDANDECLADLTLEAPNKAVAEMMVLTQLQGTSTPLTNRIDKLVVRPEGETAEAEPVFIDKELNETIGPNQPAHQPPAWGDEIKVYDPEKLAGLTPSSGARIRRAAIIASVLSSAGVAWIGWNSLHSAGEVPSAAPGNQKPASSAPSVSSEHPMPTQTQASARRLSNRFKAYRWRTKTIVPCPRRATDTILPKALCSRLAAPKQPRSSSRRIRLHHRPSVTNLNHGRHRFRKQSLLQLMDG